MKKGLLALMGASALCLSSAVLAGHSDNGAYVDAGIGRGKVNILGAGKNTGVSGTVNLGYQFNPHLAVEAGATTYKTLLNQKNYNTHLAAKGILPLGEKVDVFGKVGAAYVHSITSYVKAKSRVAPYVGVGASYWISDNVAATVQAEATPKHKQETPAMRAVSAGLTFKF